MKTELKEEEKDLQYIEDLEHGSTVERLDFVVLRRYPRQEVNTISYTGGIAAACGKDSTGIFGVVLWGDDIDKVESGDIVRITDGWCRIRDGQKVVSAGSTGKLEVIG
jgi:ssDNA-binding replication factor A large subunit